MVNTTGVENKVSTVYVFTYESYVSSIRVDNGLTLFSLWISRNLELIHWQALYFGYSYKSNLYENK